jgi:hypothetical protein
MCTDIEHWKCHLNVEDSGGFPVARPTQNDHLVRACAVRIPLRQTAVLGEADPVGSGRDRRFVASTQASTRSRPNDANAYSTTAPAASVIRPRPQACLHSNQVRPGTATSPSKPTRPTGASASRSTHMWAPSPSRLLTNSFWVSATSALSGVFHQRITSGSLNAACKPSASRFGSKGANNSRAVLSSTTSRLVAGIEAENGELACQGCELVRGPVSDQSRPLREADPDRHLDCEAAQHGTGVRRAEFDDLDPS